MLVVISSLPFCAAEGWDNGGVVELLIKQHTITRAPVWGKEEDKYTHICLLQSEAMYMKSLDATRNGGLALPACVYVCVCVCA